MSSRLDVYSNAILILFQVDDCRRTHNYDEFITKFLSMLTQEGALSGLVHQHLKSRGKLGLLQRQNRAKLNVMKSLNSGRSSNGSPNGSSSERSTKTVKRKRTVAGKKKARRKK